MSDRTSVLYTKQMSYAEIAFIVEEAFDGVSTETVLNDSREALNSLQECCVKKNCQSRDVRTSILSSTEE